MGVSYLSASKNLTLVLRVGRPQTIVLHVETRDRVKVAIRRLGFAFLFELLLRQLLLQLQYMLQGLRLAILVD